MDPIGQYEIAWHSSSLDASSLWWVADPMCDLLAAAEKSLPIDTVLEREIVPQPCGLVVFEHTLAGTDAQTPTENCEVDAILWGPVLVEDQRALGIASYKCLNLDRGLGKNELQLAVETNAIGRVEKVTDFRKQLIDDVPGLSGMMHGDIWAPLGRSDWRLGHRLDDRHHPALSDQAIASMIEDRRRLATLWLLASQPGIAETRLDPLDRPTRRREQRAGREPSPVRIVSLPVRPHTPAAASTGGDRRHVSVRFFVEGFWRNQAYGPERSKRRPTWVHAHWRGPEDGPVRVRDKVRVVRPDE